MRAADRAPAERPPTISGDRVRSRSAAATRAASRVGGAVATLRPARFHGCSNRTTVTSLRGRWWASASRSRVSMPTPAPWLSSRVAIGRRARSVTSRPSPWGVSTSSSERVTAGSPPAAAARAARGRCWRRCRPPSRPGRPPAGRAPPARGGRAGSPSGCAGRATSPTGRRSTISGIRSWIAAHVVLGLGGDDGAGPPEPVRIVVVAGRVAPDLVQAGHREGAVVLRADEERLLARLALRGELLGGIPLEVAVGGQQAASDGEGPLERRLLGDRLHPGIDHPAADRRVLGPRRHQAPGQHPQLALGRLRCCPWTAGARRRRRPPWSAPR